MQNVGQSFTDQLAGLLNVISAQGVSQVVDSFDGELTKFLEWIKSTENCRILAGGVDNESERLAYQNSRDPVSYYIQGIWLNIQKIVGNNYNLS